MGNLCPRNTAHDNITKQIDQDREAQKKAVKILLLGTSST